MKYNDTLVSRDGGLHSEATLLNLDRHLQTIISHGGKLSESDIEALKSTQQMLGIADKQHGPVLRISNSPAQNIQALSWLRKEIKTLVPVFYITVAFRADEGFEALIISQLEKTVQGPFVVRINSDPSLIAGCTLSFKGKFKDYSLKTKLVEDKGQVFKQVIGEIQ